MSGFVLENWKVDYRFLNLIIIDYYYTIRELSLLLKIVSR